ncbi:hypothetical protein V6N13_122141 [Hibiscus sabdariffa]
MFELDLPEIRGRRCWESPYGWLVTCGIDLEILLFNPLSRASLPLPSLRTFPSYDKEHWTDRPPEDYCKYYIRKLILTSSPEASESDCIVVAIYSCVSLALARPGDKIWTPIVGNIQVVDAIYFRVQFSPSHPHDFDRQYIFDLAGNLCVVARGIIPFVYDDGDDDDDDDDDKQYLRTVEFKIFKLDMHTKSWEEIFSLDDHSLFLGNCSTFAVDGYSGCKPNCIYFTDDIFEYYETKTGNTDTGIYDCRNIKLDIRKRYYEIEDIDEYVEGLVEDFPNPEDMQHLLLSPFFQHLWIIPYSC